LGAKRNAACEEARGEIILHWDDDDWYPPDCITRQIEALSRENADVSGSSRIYFLEQAGVRAWEYAYSGLNRPWVAGTTLAYSKTFWSRNRFPELQVGEDSRFVWSHSAIRVVDLDDPALCIATIHAANTSRKQPVGSFWKPVDRAVIDSIISNALVDARPGPGLPERAPHEERGVEYMKLNLGCCDAPVAGYVNVDMVSSPGFHVVVDLRQPWPWPDNSVSHIRAFDIVEHLPDKILTMNELWRVLAPGDTVEIAVPTTDGSGAFQDPTHVSFWNRRSFLYYEAGNPYRERFARSYGIRAKFQTSRERMEKTIDGPRLVIELKAVKP